MANHSLSARLRVLEGLLRAAATVAIAEGHRDLSTGLWESAARVGAWVKYVEDVDRRRASAAPPVDADDPRA